MSTRLPPSADGWWRKLSKSGGWWVIVAAPSRKRPGWWGSSHSTTPVEFSLSTGGERAPINVAFRGQYDYSLDAKNRVNLPPNFRHQLSDGLVISIGFDPCIAIYTPDGFDEIQEKALADVRPLTDEHRAITRRFNNFAFDTELDASGRIVLKPLLLEHAGIEKAVRVTGCKDYIEIWNPTTWQAAQDDTDILEVMGSLGHTA